MIKPAFLHECHSSILKERLARFPLIFGALLLMALAQVGSANRVNAQSLMDALTAAYLNNPTLLSQRARVRGADEQVPQALSNWRPEISLSGSLGRSITTNTARISGSRNQIRTPRGTELEISQSLFRGGRTLAATRKAENTVQAERARLAQVEQNVLLRAATTYLNVFRDEAVLELNINNERVLKRQLEVTRARFEVGEITRTDVHQADARLAGATADRIDSEGNLETSRAAYRNVVGLPAPRNLTPSVQLPEQPSSREEANKVAAVNNPVVIAAEFDMRALRDNVDEVRGELLPSLNLNFIVSRDFEAASNTSILHEKSITASVTVPLYQQGEVFSRLREAKQAVAERLRIIDQARRNAVEETTRAWETLLTARARVKSFKTQIKANMVALNGVKSEAQVGSRTILDVLDAEQELLDSRVAHVRAQRDELVTTFDLQAAIGKLTAKDLQLKLKAYDPADHYNEVRDKWFGGDEVGDTK